LIKLVAIDLDGTLLNSKSKIASGNRKAIQKCLGSGIKVIISTGKSICTVGRIINELNLVDPQIASGGEAIVDKNLSLLVTLRIPKISCIEVLLS